MIAALPSGILVHGRHVQPDFARGDVDTIGGYAAVHDRPAAFEGPDGMSYSVELLAAETGDPARPWGGYLFFVRWRRIGASSPEGHLESGFEAWGDTEADAISAIGRLPLSRVRDLLADLVVGSQSGNSVRRWRDGKGETGDADSTAPDRNTGE